VTTYTATRTLPLYTASIFRCNFNVFEPRQGNAIPQSCHVVTRGVEQKATGTIKFINTTKTQLNAELNCHGNKKKFCL